MENLWRRKSCRSRWTSWRRTTGAGCDKVGVLPRWRSQIENDDQGPLEGKLNQCASRVRSGMGVERSLGRMSDGAGAAKLVIAAVELEESVTVAGEVFGPEKE